jgi:hypothetical protein
MAYSIKINAVDRTADVIAQSVVVEDILNDQQNTCSFKLINLSGGTIPDTDQEVIITMADASILFGGYVTSVNMANKGIGTVEYEITCADYTRLLDRNLAHKTYENMTDLAIIQDLVSTYCLGSGITTTNAIVGVTISQISFNYIQLSQAMRRICELTGRSWYIDYSKDIHYFPSTTTAAPFNITDSVSTEYNSLHLKQDASQLRNRVYVRGGTYLSDYVTYSSKGDGVKKQFVMPDKAHSVTATVNGVSKTIGIKNVDTSGYDWYLNYQEKYIEQDTGASVLTSSDTLIVTYKYDIPVLVAVESPTSIAESGQREFAIFDKTIATTQAARDRASAELTDYANSLVDGQFTTHTAGFKSGQYLTVTLAAYGINSSYLITRVTSRSLGAGTYVYQVTLASAKTMGIIKFLIELLEANRNLVELDPNEVVDELFTCTDSLMSDSLTDALTIDSAGPYATWCTDSTQSSPTTRARWDLFQWG